MEKCAEVQDLFRSLVDHERVAVAVYEPVDGNDFVFRYVNPAYQMLKAERIAGRRYTEVFPELAKDGIPRLLKVLETGEDWVERDVPRSIETSPGATHVGYFTFDVRRIEVGGRLLLFSVARDTTAEVEARQGTERVLEERDRLARELDAQRARLQQELDSTSLLLRAADAIGQAVGLDRVLQTVADVLVQLVGHTRSWVFVWDEDQRTALLSASAGRDPLPTGTAFPFDELSVETRDVVTGRRTHVVDYDSMPPEDRGRAERVDSHMSLLVPLVQKGLLVGVIGIDDPGERREFKPREIAFVEGIAPPAAIAIENARLYARQVESAGLSRVLTTIDEALHSTLDFDKIMQRVATDARRALSADASVVELRERDAWPVRYASGLPPDVLGRPLTPEDPAISRTIARAGDAIAVEDAAADEQAGRMAAAHGICSFAGVPLILRGETFGTLLLVYRREKRRLTDEELDFVRRLGSSASLAIETSRLYAAVRDELSRTSVLLDVAAASSELDVRDVADKVLETSQRLLGARSGVVYSLDEEAGVLRKVALRGYPREAEPLFEEVPVDELSMSGQSVSRNRLLTYSHAELPPATRRRADEAGEVGNTWVAIPAHARGRVGGSIALVFDREHPFSAEDLDLFEGVGDQLGVAMENARLFGIERERARSGAAMVEINAALASSLSIDETLPAVLSRVCSDVGAHVVAIADRIEAGWRIREMSGDAGPVFVPGFVFPDAQAPTLMRLLQEREPDFVPDVMTAEHANRVVASMAGYRGYVAQPLVSHGTVVGALGVFFSEPRSPSEIELDYFRRVAFAISLAEENARLYEAEHRIAETLQTALLSLPGSMPGVEFAHLYRSATEAARVGGDFYDLFELEHRKVGVTVGDISGHGVDAAVLTSLVKNAIRVGATQQHAPAPDQVMAATSKLLYDNSPDEIFATVFFGVLDLDGGSLEFCSAGHTTGACVCGTGGVRRLPANSGLVGALADQRFETSVEPVRPGDLLFLYTDGLTEARRDHELFGEERLFDLLEHEHGDGPEATLHKVVDAVLRYTGGRLSDDLAILALRRIVSLD